MLVPIILGSDKTTVSVATGNNEYYPVYISIGNIHNTTRRARRNGVALIGFLAIPKSESFVFCPINTHLTLHSGERIFVGCTVSEAHSPGIPYLIITHS